MFRLFGLAGKFYKAFYRFLRTNGLIYALSFTVFVVIIGALGMTAIEDMTFKDAVWWSFVTATTVGYGDLSPGTGLGRLITSFLMLAGIGTIGMITGTIATYFLSDKEEISEENPLLTLVNSASDFNNSEKKEIFQYIEFIKNKRIT